MHTSEIGSRQLAEKFNSLAREKAMEAELKIEMELMKKQK
jgi:hypothetical protein